MKPASEIKQTPLKSGEASELQLLWGCRELIDGVAPHLKARLQECGEWSAFRTIQAFLPKVTNQIMLTVPLDKAERFLWNLGNQEIRVVPKSSLQSRPGCILIEEDALRDLFVFGMRNACVLCDGSHQQRKNCQLRRILKKTTLFELQENDAECLGQWLFARCEK